MTMIGCYPKTKPELTTESQARNQRENRERENHPVTPNLKSNINKIGSLKKKREKNREKFLLCTPGTLLGSEHIPVALRPGTGCGN